MVPVGPASIVGYALTAIGGAATAWAASKGHPAVSAETCLIVTFAAGLLTNAGRHLQAALGVGATTEPAEALTDRPESGVTPEAPPPAAS